MTEQEIVAYVEEVLDVECVSIEQGLLGGTVPRQVPIVWTIKVDASPELKSTDFRTVIIYEGKTPDLPMSWPPLRFGYQDGKQDEFVKSKGISSYPK